MAMHQRVGELQAYVVPFEERECPEHTFLVPFHKNNLKGKAKDYPIIWKIVYALLNAIGGILILESSDILTEIEWDLWRQSCCDYMQSFRAENIVASIGIKTFPQKMMMFIPSSPKSMLYNMCITIRSAAGNQRVLDLDLVGTIMSRISEKQQHLDLDPAFTFDDVFPHGECQNREYKYWKVGSFDEITSHIAPGSDEGEKAQKAAKQFQRTLLAMANESCGGEVIIGIYEDRQQGKLLIKGLHLEDADREAFEEKIDEALKNDPVTGEPRVWREPGRFPEKNTDWRVSYHDVNQTPGNERRVIARIQVDHYPGGVFESEPVAYDIDEDGFVTEIPFSEWTATVQQNMQKSVTSSTMTTSSKEMKITSTRTSHSRMISQSKSITNTQEGASSDSEIRDDGGTLYVEAKDPDAINAALKDRSVLSWTKDKLNWSEGIGDSEVEVESYITGDSCFVIDHPLKFVPPKDHVLQNHPDTVSKIQEIEKFYASDKGFVICAKSWMSHLSKKMTTPKGHLMDLVVFVQRGSIHELHLWVISETDDDLEGYAIQSGLSLKQQLIMSGCPGISVICHILERNNERHSSGHQEEIKRYLCIRSEKTVDLVKRSLSKILFQKDSYITTPIGDEALIKLTEEQARTLFTTEFCQLTFIRGPPGSGKTILAQFIAKQYDQAQVAFICTTESFQKYIEFVLGCKTFLAKRGSDLIKSITPEDVQNIKGLIFDDVHNLISIKEEWYKILKMLVLLQKNVYFFADPFIQVYKDTNSMAALQDAIKQIKVEYLIPTSEKQLTEVHRNTRKVTSFIKDAVSPADTYPGGVHIKAVHTLNGDDIEMIYKGDLRIDGAQNGLVILIKTLMTKNAVNRGFIYKAREIAVLIDGEEAYKDKIFYIEVLSKHLGCKVQGAKDFPREGVQVDMVDEYVGLDAAVVIHLNSQPTFFTTQIRNAKYRSFIASRGIFRVIFLVDKPLNHQHYKQMKLDRPLKCNPAFIEDGSNSSNKNDPDSVKAVRALNLEVAVTEFIDTISQLPATQGGARGVLQELHYPEIDEVVSKLNSLTNKASSMQDGVLLRQYHILCMDSIFQLLHAMLKVYTPDFLVSHTWEIISHLSIVPSNISDIIDRGVIELGIQYVMHYHHSHDTVKSVLHLLSNAADESPQILVENDCVEMLLRFLSDENQVYSYLACSILTKILADPNLDLTRENKSSISDKMESAIQAWRGYWSLNREGFSDVKSWLTNKQWPVLERLAVWEIKYFIRKNPHQYAPIIVRDVGWQTLSENVYLDATLKGKLRTLGFIQQRVDSRMRNTQTKVKGTVTGKKTFIKRLGESVDHLRAKLEDLDYTHDVGATATGRIVITEKDCKMLEIAITPVLAQLERAWSNNQELLKHCQELYSKHILFIMEFVSRLEGVSEDIIYGIWQIAMYIETALNDHTPFVDRGMVEWGVTCIQTYQHNEELVYSILQIHERIADTHPMALVGISNVESLKQLLWGRRQKLSVTACVTLAKILSAPDVDIPQHHINSISEIMKQTIQSWDVDLDIGMELPTFTAVKSWLLNEKHPVLQQFAAVVIFYFIKRDASKYIPLIEKDVRFETLEELSIRKNITPETRHVLQKIMKLHKSHTQKQSAVFDEEKICRLM